jgi:hypothetical protein
MSDDSAPSTLHEWANTSRRRQREKARTAAAAAMAAPERPHSPSGSPEARGILLSRAIAMNRGVTPPRDPWAPKEFDEIDLNRDGVIDRSEWEAVPTPRPYPDPVTVPTDPCQPNPP